MSSALREPVPAAGLVLAGLLLAAAARAETEEPKKIDFRDDFVSGSLAASSWEYVEDFDVAEGRLVRAEDCDSVLSRADVKDANIGNSKTSRDLRFTAGGVDLGDPDSPYLRSVTLRVERGEVSKELIYATLQACRDETGDFEARYLLGRTGETPKEQTVDAAQGDLVLTIVGDKAELAFASGDMLVLALSDAQENPVYMCRVEMQADLRLVASPSVEYVEAKSEWE